METFDSNSGPQRFLSILRSIKPQVFFTLSTAPFKCKELLPCWAQLRNVHVLETMSISNDLESDWAVPQFNVFFRQNSALYKSRLAGAEDVPLSIEDEEHPDPYIRKTSRYIRSAIQLRPVLERIHQAKGHKPLHGQDIVDYVTSKSHEQD